RRSSDLRVGARRGNGVAMRVEAYETRLRIGRGHDERRMAVATTYVGDPAPPLQALDDTVESGQPRRYEVCPVRRPEEGRAAAGQALVVIAPGDAFAGAKGAQHLVFVEPDRGRNVPGRRDENRAVLAGEDHGLLGRQLVGIASRVVHDV